MLAHGYMSIARLKASKPATKPFWQILAKCLERVMGIEPTYAAWEAQNV